MNKNKRKEYENRGKKDPVDNILEFLKERGKLKIK